MPAPVAPRSIRSLTPSQARLVDRVTYAELERRKAVELVDERVLEARAKGLTWSVLGYALGTSSQAVSKKYGARADG